MKRYTWQPGAFLGVLLTTAMAVAQSNRVLETAIPFPVVVAARTLTTGRYAVLSSSHNSTFC